MRTIRPRAPGGRPFLRRRIPLAARLCGLCIIALAACAPVRSAEVSPPNVVLWGDSFGETVAPFLPANYDVRAFGGTAPCDWLDDIRSTSAQDPPDVAVLLFVGNTHTPCTGGTTDGYAVDVAHATMVLQAAGSEVVIVAAPPFDGSATPADEPAPNPVNVAYGHSGAALIWGPSESVAPGGEYTTALRDPDGAHLNAVGARRFAEAIRREVG